MKSNQWHRYGTKLPHCVCINLLTTYLLTYHKWNPARSTADRAGNYRSVLNNCDFRVGGVERPTHVIPFTASGRTELDLTVSGAAAAAAVSPVSGSGFAAGCGLTRSRWSVAGNGRWRRAVDVTNC